MVQIKLPSWVTIYLSAVAVILFGLATGKVISFDSPAFGGLATLLGSIIAFTALLGVVYEHIDRKRNSERTLTYPTYLTAVVLLFLLIIAVSTFSSLLIVMAQIDITPNAVTPPPIGIQNTPMAIPLPPKTTSSSPVSSFEIGDLATWVAAIGTICTLGFLINQHTQLREAQKQEKAERKAEEEKQKRKLQIELEKREDHEIKQQQMWHQQETMLSFQKYQIHRREFDAILDNFERKHPNIYVEDRNCLYELIYKNNSPSNCVTNIPLERCSVEVSELSVLLKDYNMALGAIKQSNSVKHKQVGKMEEIRRFIETLTQNLQLKHKNTPSFGDCCQNKEVMFNIFELRDTLDATRDLMLSLLQYSENQDIVLGRFPTFLPQFQLNLISWAAGERSPRVVHLDNYSERLRIVVESIQLLVQIRDDITQPYYSIFFDVYRELLAGSEETKNILIDENHQKTIDSLAQVIQHYKQELAAIEGSAPIITMLDKYQERDSFSVFL
jgi:hypothetical protein